MNDGIEEMETFADGVVQHAQVGAIALGHARLEDSRTAREQNLRMHCAVVAVEAHKQEPASNAEGVKRLAGDLWKWVQTGKFTD